MTTPSPAARTIRTELIAQGWLNIEDHGAVHKIIDQALAEERKAAEEMVKRLEQVESLLPDSMTWGELLESGSFEEKCDILGLNQYAMREGRADSDDTIDISTRFRTKEVIEAYRRARGQA